jgi:putative membrane protein
MQMMWDGNHGWDHGSDYGGWLMLIGMILLTVAVVLLIVYLVRLSSATAASRAGGSQVASIGPATAPEPPRDIVKRRYAAGEIDREKYLELLKDL